MVLMILVGFPIALVLAWAFNVTPRGVVQTDGADRPETSPARVVMRRDPIVHAMFLVWLDQKANALDVLEGNLVGRTSIQTQLL